MNSAQRWLVVASIGLLAAAPARAATYSIDTAHSQVQFRVKHLGISTVAGRFGKFSGSFDLDPSDPGTLAVSAKVDVASIDTGEPKRDEHLRSETFFDVAKFPEIAFKSTSVEALAENKLKITGDLTLHGVTRAVVLEAEIGGAIKDPWGVPRAAISAKTTIQRQDFGLTWNKVLDSGGLMIGNAVQVILDVEGVAKTETK